MDHRLKQSEDVKKSSKVKETSEQRARRYSRFKAFAVGGLLATAGMISAEGRQLQGTEPHLLEQKNVTQPEFDPSRVPPGFIDYLRDMKLPESTIRDVQRRVLAEQRRKLEPGGYDLTCLDVSASQVAGSAVSSLPDTGLPGVLERVDYSLNVRNKCPVPVDNVVYVAVQRSTCPPPTNPATDVRQYTYDADPTLVGVGENSGMLGPKYTLAGCQNLVNDVPVSFIPPEALTVSIMAMGEVPGATPGTIDIVSSIGKAIDILP